MTQFTFRCPGCQQAIALRGQYRGRHVKCPKCQTVIALPPAAGRPAANASVTPPRTGPGPSMPAPAHRGVMPNMKNTDDADDLGVHPRCNGVVSPSSWAS